MLVFGRLWERHGVPEILRDLAEKTRPRTASTPSSSPRFENAPASAKTTAEEAAGTAVL